MSRDFAGTSLTTCPSIDTVPALIGSRPAIMRSTVDLPQPEGPSSTMNSPSATPKLTSWTARAVAPGYSFDSASTVTVATLESCSRCSLAHRAGGHALDHRFGKKRVDHDD